MSFNLQFFLQNLYFINHAFIKIEIFYAFKEAKKFYQSVLRCLQTFPWVLKIRPIHVYFKSNRHTHYVYTLLSHIIFISGQTNKKSYRTLYMKGP